MLISTAKKEFSGNDPCEAVRANDLLEEEELGCFGSYLMIVFYLIVFYLISM